MNQQALEKYLWGAASIRPATQNSYSSVARQLVQEVRNLKRQGGLLESTDAIPAEPGGNANEAVERIKDGSISEYLYDQYLVELRLI